MTSTYSDGLILRRLNDAEVNFSTGSVERKVRGRECDDYGGSDVFRIAS